MTRLRITAMDIRRWGGAVSGVASARSAWNARQGLLLQLWDDLGHQGLGEASPLPGYSPDDLAACEAELHAFEYSAPDLDLDLAPDGLDGGPPASLRTRLAAVTSRVRAPAARFALETALLDVIARRASRPLWHVLRALAGQSTAHAADVALNAVCAASDVARVLDEIAAARDRGIGCFKLKVGRDFERELAVLEAVRARHGNEISLRVDANQAWTPDESRAHLQRLVAVAPEYVEEPVPEPLAHLPALAPLPVPVALDESLAQAFAGDEFPVGARGAGLDALLAGGLVSVLVLKPMLLGGLTRVMALAARARVHGADIVISHLFDGPVALAACAHLAVALATPRPCGLDRHAGLQAWPEIVIPFVGQARIAVPHQIGLGISAPLKTRP
jgi:o-succinylbenzoate synthase